MDPDIAGKRVGKNNTPLFSWNGSVDAELILLIVISTINTTIVSIVNAAIPGLPDPSNNILQLWGSHEEPNGNGGLQAQNLTPILDYNTVVGWVKVAMKLINPTL